MGKVKIVIHGITLTHRRPGPWKAEKFESGAACVTNALGINWISGLGGATLFDHEVADVVAAKFNAEAVNDVDRALRNG